MASNLSENFQQGSQYIGKCLPMLYSFLQGVVLMQWTKESADCCLS